MKNWEFLIQKEGDAEWLTLESPTVEILEGCYQVMAYSCLPSSMIKIQICHTFVEHGVSQQQCHQRSQQSSPTGAIEVMPFAYLEPGLWTLACRLPPGSNLHTELPLLQLQVLPQVELCADWDIDPSQQDHVTEQYQTLDEEKALPDSEESVEPVEQEQQTDQAAVIASLENALRNFSSEPVFEQYTPSLNFTDLHEAMGDVGSEVPFTQDMLELLFQHLNDASLPSNLSDIEINGDDLDSDELNVLDLDGSLTNPSLQVPIFDAQELSPTFFDSPTQLSSLVILDQSAYTAIAGETIEIAGRVFAEGELVIRLRDPLTQEQVFEQIFVQPQPNFPSSFSHLLIVPSEHRVLVGEAKLVAANQAHEIRSTQAFMITVIAAPVASNLIVEPIEVEQVEVEQVEPDDLVAAPSLETAPSPLGSRKPKSEQVLELPIIDATAGLPPLQPASGPNLPPQLYPLQTARKPLRSPALPQFLQRQPAQRELVRTGRAKPPEADSETLDLGKRFWSTLSTLAHQVDLVPASSSDEADSSDLLGVVELPTFDQAAPLPIPTLILPERDLRAGLPLVVEVRLPDTEAQLCIKLWVIDQATQAIVVSPRWLVDFSYNPRQEILETSTQLSLPSTSPEVAFKAIAVDMASQQESPPLTIVRSLLTEQAQ